MSNLVVQTNVLALNAHRNIQVVGSLQSKASQKLSSGYRINTAADDAAGLAISEKMRSQIRGLDMASKNAADGQSLVNTAEGGLQEIDNMLQRIRELTVQASTDTNDQQDETDIQGDRRKIQDEIDSLTAEIDSMAERIEFNKKKVISGAYSDGETVASLFKSSDTNAAGDASAAANVAPGAGLQLDQLNSLAKAVAGASAVYCSAAMGTTLAAAFSALAESISVAIDAGLTGSALVESLANMYSTFKSAYEAEKTDGTIIDTAKADTAINSFVNSLKQDPTLAAAIDLIDVIQENKGAGHAASSITAAVNAVLTAVLSGKSENVIRVSLASIAAGATLANVVNDADGSVAKVLTALENVLSDNLKPLAELYKNAFSALSKDKAANVLTAAASNLLNSLVAGEPVAKFQDLLTSLNSVVNSLVTNAEALADKDGSVAAFLDSIAAVSPKLEPYTDLIKAAQGATLEKGATAAKAFLNAIIASGASLTTDILNKHIGLLDNELQLGNISEAVATNLRNAGKAVLASLGEDRSLYIVDPADPEPVFVKKPTAESTPAESSNSARPNKNAIYFQIGANAEQGIYLNIRSVKTDVLGIGDGNGKSSIDVMKTTGDQITQKLDDLDKALTFVTTERSKLGAVYNRLEYTQKSLDISSENLSAAESRIRDTDMAKEMMAFTKANVLNQAGISMLAQANQAPQNILSLLR